MAKNETSQWKTLEMDKKIEALLRKASKGKHHFGRPFLTAYQIAILFYKTHKDDTDKIDLRIGGKGNNYEKSLSWYIARNISMQIKASKRRGIEYPIEGSFLNNQYVVRMEFYNPEKPSKPIKTTLIGKAANLSMFRIKD